MELWEVCPQLVRMNKEGTYYDGYINVVNRDFRLNITLPPDRCLQQAQINFEPNLYYMLQEYQPLVKQRLALCSDLATFLHELKVLIEGVLEKSIDMQDQHIRVSSQLLGELRQLGWDKLVYISSSFREVHVSTEDEEGRSHILKVQLHAEHPRVTPVCITDLPKRFKFSWSPSSKLTDLHHQFEMAVQSYQLFWNAISEIDQKTWVLEPEKPTFSATYRRIAISSNSSVQVTFDPANPYNFVQCQFMGADNVVEPLKRNLNVNLQKWDVNRGVLQNLEDLLEIDFPSPSFTKKEEFVGECGICYAYRLSTELPTKVCENVQCGQPYHQSCLYEWLKTLSSSRYSFNVVFGECPMCSKPITVTVTTGD